MLIAAAERTTIDDRKDRRLRAIYRRELRVSVRSSALIFAAGEVPAIMMLGIVRPDGSSGVIALDTVMIALGLLIAYIAPRGGRRYIVAVAMLLGLLPIVVSVALAVSIPELSPIAVGILGMVPLAFVLFIPLDRWAHRLWVALAIVTTGVTVAAFGGNSALATSPVSSTATLFTAALLSIMANEVLVRRREQANRQMLAVRGLYRQMKEREIDLRRQDEFLMMQQETLVVQQAELLRLNEELETIARIDALTGLGNRLRLNEDLAQLAGRIERSGGSAGLLLLDLDSFKRLNDTCGHLAGDAALKGVAEVLRRTARVGDGLYRYGGEEFLIVLHDCDERTMELAGQRFISAVQGAAMRHPDNQPWGVVTTSAGAAELSQRNGADVDAALRAADEALYQAKARGRNRLEIHVYRDQDDIVPIDRKQRAAS